MKDYRVAMTYTKKIVVEYVVSANDVEDACDLAWELELKDGKVVKEYQDEQEIDTIEEV